MTITEFAEKHRLTVKKDSCGESIIAGKPRKAARVEDRAHVFEYGTEKFSIYLPMGSVGKWNNRKKAALAAGFALTQDGDTEGILSFDPKDAKQSKLAVKLVGAREKAILSPEKLAELQERGKRLASLRSQ